MIVLLLLVATGCAGTSVDRSYAEQAFDDLRELEGVWRKKGTSGEKFRIAFEPVARDSVLVETWYRGEQEHSLTIYHLAGENLMATHYCPQGNQPRLLLRAGGARDTGYEFEFLDVTNLSERASYQCFLSLDLSDLETGLRRSEKYRSVRGEHPDTLTLERM